MIWNNVKKNNTVSERDQYHNDKKSQPMAKAKKKPRTQMILEEYKPN